MSLKSFGSVSAFRLFYDDVVEDVRNTLRSRLGCEAVPITELQREIGRLWKDSSKQEEYRQKAELLRQSLPVKPRSESLQSDLTLPLHKLRRILDLDDDGPRVTKDTLRALGTATSIFLTHIASRVHKHIVEGELSYPAKPDHIYHVINDPRYLMYQFLACCPEHLAPQQSAIDDIEQTYHSDISSIQPTEAPVEGMPSAQVEPQLPTDEKLAKKRSRSILSYFGSKNGV